METKVLKNSARRTVSSLVAALLLAASGVAAMFWFFGQIEKTARVRSQSVLVLRDANALLSAMKDAETGQRGYVLTGDERFLDSYLAVRGSFAGGLKALRELASSADAKSHLDALAPLLDAKLAELARVIEMRRKLDVAASEAAVKGGLGKRLMDSIRVEMNEFIGIEEAALQQNEAAFAAEIQRTFGIIVSASLLLVGFLFAIVYLLHQRTRQRISNAVHLETREMLGFQEATSRELQQVNTSLQDSEEKLAVTLNSIGDAVLATDVDARVTHLNRVAEQLTGWTQAQAAGLPVGEIFQIINQETRQPVSVPVIETLSRGTLQGLANHTILIARDGSECAIADSCAPIRDRNGQVIGAVLVFRDVTAEYAIQQALRDSAALIQSVLNSVADGIITLRASGGIIEKANPAAERMFGYASGDVVGKSFGQLIPELDRDQGNGSIDYYSASDQQRSIGQGREVTGRRKDGSTFSMEIVVSEMFLGGERFFTGILRDITTRKQSEEALFRAGALQRAIFNSANFSSIATDASGVIQIFNVGAERMLGYAADEVMNRITPAEISDPQEVIARAKALSVEFSTPILPGFEALAFKASRGIEDIYELTYVRKDGSRLPAAVSVTALRDPQNAIIGYLLIGTDNTARKHVEAERQKLDQRLRDQQFYTRSLIESNIDALMTTDQFGIITDVNKQMETLTGCTRDELIGAPFKNYFTDAERAEAGIKQVMNENKLTNYELTARARDGRETVVSYNATTFYDRNRTLQGVFAAARDITERKLMDQALQNTNLALETAKSVAEKANLAKSEFLSSMSHELRTPLSAILGFAQLIESGTPQLSPTQKRGIDQILKAGWYLLDLINEILDLALIESGKLSLSLEPVSLTTVMHECEEITETQAEKRGVRISFPTFDKELFVQADRIRLKQSLINLLSNAIKYNKANGTVVVSFVEKAPGRIRICVEDTGEGLSPEQLERLFQPFNRLGQESTAEEGTGIGLVVCKRLIELMGGVIGVESTVGRGSVFWIELRLTGEQHFGIGSDEISTLARRLVRDGAQLHTLLYVEDNPANLMLVEDLIARRSDIRLLSARDGRAGIDIALVAQPDVILMDINLPDISGITVLKILATDPATAHIPVIALSANAIPRDIEKGLEAGFFRYLTKPILVNQLMDTLDEAFALANVLDAPAPDEQET